MELDFGVEFRNREFGMYQFAQGEDTPQTTLAGKNLDYYEQGAREEEGEAASPLNIVFPIIKNVVPTLFFQNPRVTVKPMSRTDTAGEDAFYVRELMNEDLRDPILRIKETGQLATFDGYVLASGFVKIGYATEFGSDITPTKAEERKKLRERLKDQAQQLLAKVGLVEPPEAEPEVAPSDATIRSESPYIKWISPFEFVIDPRARSMAEARWVAQLIRRTLKEVKEDRRYGRAKFELTPDAVNDPRIDASMLDDFQTVDVWEIHYKTPDSETGIRVLTLAATQQQTKALMHEDNPYDLGDWQYEWLTMNKHGHRLYPISTVSVIRPLVDRLNSSFDAILEQADKFVAKIAYNERVTKDGEVALEAAEIGARVKLSGTDAVTGSIAVVSMEQIKQDLMLFVNQVLDLIILVTGLTRAQLTGLSTANTATEAQIGQSGQTLRRTDESNGVSDWFARVLVKYWRVKAQFQDLTEIALVKDVLPNAQTGMLQTQWYPAIDPERAERLKKTRFRFELEVSSMQKPNLEIIRAQFEAFMRALMEPVVTQGLALDGKRISVEEAIRQWSRFFTEQGLQDLSKLLVPVANPQQQLALQQFGQMPKGRNGQAPLAGQVPNIADVVSAVAGERGQGVPLA
jgi:hypothetical protein